jgi:GT2 family glycosyltransferase
MQTSLMSKQIVVVIPAYGLVELTRTLVGDCLRETALVDVLVVDNMGDYSPVGLERVLAPRKNLGWLRGTNEGFRVASREGYAHLVALNNDTRLSTHFFAGLLDAVPRVANLGLLAPCYDDNVVEQRHFSGPAQDFAPQAREDVVRRIDGTCFLIPATAYQQIGDLDERHFGRRGWGGMEDYCIRTALAGLKIAVTHRAYLTHARGSTAHHVESAYERYAVAEMRRGMRRKWGAHWREHFPETFGAEFPKQRYQDLLRHLEDRAGLSTIARISQRGTKRGRADGSSARTLPLRHASKRYRDGQ